MSDTIEDYKAMGAHRKALRKKYGVPCSHCALVRPNTNPSILLPQQRCRVDGYADPRPTLTDEQWRAA